MSRCIHLSLLVLLLTAGCKSFSQPLTWPFSRDTPSASQDRTSATEASGQVSRVEQANRLLLAEGQGLEREGKLQDGLVPEQLVQFSLFCYDFADVRVE